MMAPNAKPGRAQMNNGAAADGGGKEPPREQKEQPGGEEKRIYAKGLAANTTRGQPRRTTQAAHSNLGHFLWPRDGGDGGTQPGEGHPEHRGECK